MVPSISLWQIRRGDFKNDSHELIRSTTDESARSLGNQRWRRALKLTRALVYGPYGVQPDKT